VARGYEFVLNLASETDPVPVDVSLVLNLHRVSFEHIYDWAGKWRAIELDYPLDTCPPAYIVERTRAMLDNLDARLQYLPEASDPNHRTAAVELVAWFQHAYVKIHPFRDFNGRTARMLSTYLLLLQGYPYVEIRAEEGADRDVYVAAMRAADAYDLGPLQGLISAALDEAAAS
jgi:cell filamentation protein